MGSLRDDAEQLLADFCAIAPPRTKYELDKFVIEKHETKEQCFAQCVCELQSALVSKMRAKISERIMLRKIAMLEAKGNGEDFDHEAKHRADALDNAQLAKLDLFVMRLASLGNDYQIEHLDKRRREMGHFTREDIDATDPERFRLRAIKQASQDVTATGRVSVSNQEMLRLIGEKVPLARDHLSAVTQRFLEVGNIKILIAIPTLIDREQIKANGLKCLEGWSIPGVFQQRQYVITGRTTAEAYNDAVLTASEDGADFILCVEDDHVIPAGTFEKLWSIYQQYGPRAIVGAWYPQKREPRTGAAILLRRGRREYLNPDDGETDFLDGHGLCENELEVPMPGVPEEDRGVFVEGKGHRPAISEHRGGAVREVYAVTQGFTLIPTSIFNEIPRPWFFSNDAISQDGFFSQLAREAGWKLLIDTSARIKHVCRETGRVYE